MDTQTGENIVRIRAKAGGVSRANLPKLTVDDDLAATFDAEGGNHEQLNALDRAEWRVRPLSADELCTLDKEETIDMDRIETPGTPPTVLQYLDLFVSRADEGDDQPQMRTVTFTAGHDDYVRSLSRQALFSGNALGAARYILDNPYGTQRDGLSSVYVDRYGTIHVLRPHGHTVAAFNAIRDNLPPEYETHGSTLPKSPVDFRDLTRLSGGIMRGQFYPHGVGMSVDLQNPPTPGQLRAMEEYQAITPQKTFVAEIYDGDGLIGHARSLAALRCVLAKAQGGVHEAELQNAVADCGDVVIQADLPESIGGRIGG